MKKSKRKLYMIEILGLLLALLWLSPFYLMIVNAFKTKREIFSGVLGLPKEITIDNFVKAFNDLDFFKSLFNSVTNYRCGCRGYNNLFIYGRICTCPEQK